MKKIGVIIICLFSSNLLTAKNYVDYNAIHRSVDITLKEKNRTEKIKNKQIAVTGLEQANKEQGSKLKNKVVKIQNRLKSLGIIFDSANVILEVKPMITQVSKNIEKIVNEAVGDPLIIATIYPMEKEFVSKVKDLGGFMTAIILSYGVINQMKDVDRKILLDHVVLEVGAVLHSTEGALSIIRDYKMNKLLLASEWKMVKNRERDIIKEILQNANKY